MEERELRRILQSILADEYIPKEDAEMAAAEIRDIIEEAKEHGLKEAEAVKAILSPVFSNRQKCNCSSCRARRLTAV